MSLIFKSQRKTDKRIGRRAYVKKMLCFFAIAHDLKRDYKVACFAPMSLVKPLVKVTNDFSYHLAVKGGIELYSLALIVGYKQRRTFQFTVGDKIKIKATESGESAVGNILVIKMISVALK